ncbi:hypothetical protein G7Y89_g9670 [Cudoniella acicularis]|uniref:Uncharacterized protein n=1 Tax=Cudoniella acicularis TaxID=354080 RepID=A0A8H4VZW7_9HELO|nr:hypothetical protein G7Y89_g9670 [Cudoniella acicularis]
MAKNRKTADNGTKKSASKGNNVLQALYSATYRAAKVAQETEEYAISWYGNDQVNMEDIEAAAWEDAVERFLNRCDPAKKAKALELGCPKKSPWKKPAKLPKGSPWKDRWPPMPARRRSPSPGGEGGGVGAASVSGPALIRAFVRSVPLC